ncbi:MAG: oligopeptide/dipeptide ABC transporter ATP-binding protein, partial [Pseudomonadota bacterium]
SIPTLETDADRLNQIPGAMPRLNAMPSGCAFHPRCPEVFARCRSERPELREAEHSRAACWLVERGTA